MALATADAGNFIDNIDVVMVMTNEWYDVETNEVIPHEQIGQITNRLLEAGQLLQESTRAWNQEVKTNGGDKAAASKASDAILPGGKTRLLNALSRDKCLVNVRIVGPPVMLAGKVDKEISWEF